MATPKLRFKEFDGDWSLCSLAKISSIITGNTPSTSNREYYDGEFLFVSPADIQENRYIEKTKTTLTANGFSKCRHIPENSVLFVCIGSTIGKVAQNKVICATNQQINAVIPQKGYSSDFLYLQLERLAPNIKLNAGVQAVPLINKTEFGKTLLNTPVYIEQTKIASFLSAVDEKISQLTQKHQLLSQYKQGMMQKLFNQEIRFKADDGSEFGEWGNLKIFDLAKDKTLNNGVFNDQNKVGKGYKLINVLDMYIQRDIDESRLSLLDLDKKEFENNKVNYGDIFFTRSSLVKEGIAFSNVYLGVSDDITYDGHLIKLSPDLNMVEPKFLNYCLKIAYVRKQLIQGGKTATMTTIGQKEVGNTIVKVPCLEEQTKIANFLSSIDQKIEVVAQQIEQARTWKKGLLQQMFV